MTFVDERTVWDDLVGARPASGSPDFRDRVQLLESALGQARAILGFTASPDWNTLIEELRGRREAIILSLARLPADSAVALETAKKLGQLHELNAFLRTKEETENTIKGLLKRIEATKREAANHQQRAALAGPQLQTET